MRQNVDVGKERARERCDEIINIKVDREVKREERETVPRKTALKRIRTTQRDNKYRKRQENKK